jgi:phosphate acetyltransferase
MAGAEVVGPILGGLLRPANDLSRGCSVEDVVLTAAATALQVES